jgi:hypothetical protein
MSIFGKERTAEVGDLIIQYVGKAFRNSEPTHTYIGIVDVITSNKWGHETVYIHWNNSRPPNYHDQHGYASMNIHNLRRDFDIIKGK